MIEFTIQSKRDKSVVTMRIDKKNQQVSAFILESPPYSYTEAFIENSSKTFQENIWYCWAWFWDAVIRHNGDAEQEHLQEYLHTWFAQLPHKEQLTHDVVDHDHTILVWEWDHAPAIYQYLSLHGGDENWVIFIPDHYRNNFLDCFSLPYCGTDSARIPVYGGEVLILGH